MKHLLLFVLFTAAVSASIIDYDVTGDDKDEGQPDYTVTPDLDETPEQYDEMMFKLPPPTTTDIDEWAELFRIAAHNAIAQHNLTLGNIGPNDVLLSKTHHCKSEGDTNVAEEMCFRGLPSTIITAIRGASVSESDHPAPAVVAGGVGHNYVKIRLHSPKGQGYKYYIEIYGTR